MVYLHSLVVVKKKVLFCFTKYIFRVNAICDPENNNTILHYSTYIRCDIFIFIILSPVLL